MTRPDLDAIERRANAATPDWFPVWSGWAADLKDKFKSVEVAARKFECARCGAKVGFPCVTPKTGMARVAHMYRARAGRALIAKALKGTP